MDDVLIEKIREYRKMLKLDKPDLDMALLLKKTSSPPNSRA